MTELSLFFLKQAAKSVSLGKISAVAIRKLPEVTEKFRNWLHSGYNGTMYFLNNNIEKRENPELILDNAKTIIVVMQPYPANIKFSGEIKIAKYALEQDYHISMKNKLYELSRIIQKEFGGNFHISIDSGPVFEKDWAVISGLGWRGKNSLVINTTYGSYFNIGVMISDLDLIEEDKKNIEKINTKCGKCDLCKKSCPTGAILENGVIDAKKCIAYLTIESKLSENILSKKEIAESKYIFGCDICQDVCPFNYKFLKKNIKEICINKSELCNLSNKEFFEKFQESAIKRLRNNRLKRNLGILKITE